MSTYDAKARGSAGALLLTAVSLVFALIVNGAKADEVWNRQALESLFPAPSEGWSADEIDVKELDTVASGFEEAVTGATGVDVPRSARLQVTRKYRNGDKLIELGIDTEEIELAATVNVIHEDESVREEIAQSGKKARIIGQNRALEVYEEPKKFLVIGLGKAGVAVFTCAYDGCENEIEALAARLDFEELTRFVDYDHRKSK